MSEAAENLPISDEGMAARRVCFALIEDVLQRKQALDHALERSGDFKVLPQRDRAFTRMLVTTALRRLGQIDDLIAKALDREGDLTPAVHHILRVGVTQIAFMDVPDHAAVDTAVRLAEERGMERQKAFVNAVLRNIARAGDVWKSRQDEGRLNTPEWLLKDWIENYGLGVAARIAEANLSEAPLDISIKDEDSRNFWASNFKASEVAGYSLRRASGGNVSDLQGFDEGHWWVQDAAAAIPARLFGDVQGAHVYDLCAAPGGKTLQLASMGANVVALDRSANRLKRLEENLSRMELQDRVCVQALDAQTWAPDEPASHILLDAPCSATGTIRRHPDVLHLKSVQDVERLTHVQAQILDNAFAQLMPGGVLIYCTCSLQRAEGEAQIEALLSTQDAAERLPITAEELGGFDEAITEDGDLRILPFHQAALGGMDGFYIARLTKKV